VYAELKVPESPEDGVVSTKALEITNSRWTSVAGAFEESPDWFAKIRQIPAATIETVVPETVHAAAVSVEKATVSPRSVVAVTVKVFEDPRVRLLSEPKVIV
jgi:hypothetical protein